MSKYAQTMWEVEIIDSKNRSMVYPLTAKLDRTPGRITFFDTYIPPKKRRIKAWTIREAWFLLNGARVAPVRQLRGMNVEPTSAVTLANIYLEVLA